MKDVWWMALVGGGLIGLSVSLMLFFLGRVTGISGFLYGVVAKRDSDSGWKGYFLAGLFFAGCLMQPLFPENLQGEVDSPLWTLALAGFLVGYGTRLGGGCTSGHGVCGVSRLSPRSVAATFIFMLAGVAAVFIFRALGAFEL